MTEVLHFTDTMQQWQTAAWFIACCPMGAPPDRGIETGRRPGEATA